MQRWVLLAAISSFGFCNGLVNASDAILSTMVALMGVSLENYIYLTQVLGYLGPIMALPTAWFVDRHGVRGSCLACLFLVLLRNGPRALFFSPQLAEWHELRYVYWLSAGVAERLIVSIYYCLPLKLAEHWFSNENERSFAWCCMIVGPSLGATLISYLQPHFISGVSTVWQLAYLNLVTLIFTCSAIIASLAVLTRPANRDTGAALSERQLQVARTDKLSLKQGLVSLFTNKYVLLHLVTVNAFNSMDNVIKRLMQDILAASGFSRVFCGHLLAGLNGCSCLIMLGGSFLIKDHSGQKGNTLRCKLFIFIQWMAFNLYATSLILHVPGEGVLHGWLLVASTLLFTGCRAWAAPSLNNLLAHLIAGSTSAATLSAGGTIIDFFVSNFFTFTFVGLRQVDDTKHQTNYLKSIVFLLAMAALFSLAYLTCFSGRKQQVRLSQADADGGQQQQEWTRPVAVLSTVVQVSCPEASVGPSVAAAAIGQARTG